MIDLTRTTRAALCLGAAPLALIGAATPAFAQDATNQPVAPNAPPPQATTSSGPVANVAGQPAQATANSNAPDIVVTGTIIRNAAAATASPVTVLSAADLANRGINTVADAVQSLSANNGGTLNTNWSQFGFPKGASAPSLRGLTDARTLTVFDGLRSAPYPLADDGYRNFVDINTIPDSIVDRVEVLQDGASSTYGADAVAGVVNVIIKKQIEGLHANASAGVSQRGDGGEQRVDATWGIGKLSEQGYNFYVNAEYQDNSPLYLRDRPGPYGTSNHSDMCAPSIVNGQQTCRSNGIVNGVQFNGSYGGIGTTTVPFVRPYTAAGAPVAGSKYQLLNPAAGCQNLTPYTLTAAQAAAANAASTPATVCQQDFVNQFYQYEGRVQRVGANAHLTVNVGSHAQAYAMFNFYQTRTYNPLTPEGFANQTAAGGTQVTISPVLLPAYVCNLNGANATFTGTGITVPGGCTIANGKLNPNNPFAAQGQQARLLSRYDRPTEDDTRANTFRYSAGISGDFGGGWNYAFDVTHSEVKLKYTSKNYIFAQNFLNAIASGTYNFVDPTQNTEAQRQYIAPTQITNSVSRLTQVQGTLSKALFELPGGSLQAAIGASWRKESIHNPSSNPANEANPYARYYGINAVGVEGSRTVKSAYFEVDAPLLKQIDLKASGRYDDYSSGQRNFSPKLEAQFRPIRQIKIRGTYSKGFAIPSFNEAYGLPTTGYISTQIDESTAGGAAFVAAHGANDYAKGGYSYGLTSIGNPAVKPERSTSYTLGVVLEPVRWLTLTADYYNIKVKDLITTPNCSAAVTQYYANNGVTNVPGCVTSKGLPDPLFPNALPLLGTITSFYGNADALKTRGFDFTATGRFSLGGGTRLTSSFNGTLVTYLAKITDAGEERYDNTLGPCEITSCSGSPRFRANWQNTLDFAGKGTLSATVNYTSGYQLEGADDGGIPGDCLGSIGAEVVTYRDGATPVSCHTKRFIDVDMTASIKVANKFTLYTNILNVFDVKPPFDPSATYGITQFNTAWAGAGFIGRYIRVGAKVDF